MKRRDFLRFGAAVAGAPAVLPLIDLREPDRPWSSVRDDGDVIKLSSNENPLGIPPSARKAIVDGFPDANRYPGDSNAALVDALAEYQGVPEDTIVLGAGSTDVLRMTVQAAAAKRDHVRVVIAEPTFEDVFRYSSPFPSVELVRVPLIEGSWAHDLEAMKREADRDSDGAFVYVCNPNNPTGTVTSVAEVKAWIDQAPQHFFLVDEAYFEFVDEPEYETLIRWATGRPNVVVARTFSKVYGMAGIRVGYGVAAPRTAARIDEFAMGTNPNHLGAVGARAALEDDAYVRESIETNARALSVVHETLDGLGLDYMPSHTNFVMHEIRGSLDTYRSRMLEAGLRVGRPFPPFTDRNRLSLGTVEQMERWAETVRSFRRKGWI